MPWYVKGLDDFGRAANGVAGFMLIRAYNMRGHGSPYGYHR